ncbi:hypothetical protein I551_2026 [Mycobacterium ulcerans str. Harvey]|uniref:Uncharacterized protein n=1 Tax=Mycobacterium ulcerans str. Harvey TaxID=1299332 RepID=A0ABP3AKN1_MYCUL|nr:hypothetical protein I551_2026 [Mycobacterium ulcerans str. Harvey]
MAGGDPMVSVGGVELGLGGALNFLRITALSIVLLALGAMVSWTTNVAEIGPRSRLWAGPCGCCGSRLTNGRWFWRWRCALFRCSSTNFRCSTLPAG